GLLGGNQCRRIDHRGQFGAFDGLHSGRAGSKGKAGGGEDQNLAHGHHVFLAQRAAYWLERVEADRIICAAGPAMARPGATATASMVRLDCRFRMLTVSPCVALRWARPVMVSSMPLS